MHPKTLSVYFFFFKSRKVSHSNATEGPSKGTGTVWANFHIKCNFYPFIQLLVIERDKLKSREDHVGVTAGSNL